ncbi:hypothetical protein ACFL0V_03650 [Nanoarchaeota archaeon]
MNSIDPNVTLLTEALPDTSPIVSLVKAVSALVGGVFGIYLIMLYLRFREFYVMKTMLKAIREDIRLLAKKQGTPLPPLKKRKKFKSWWDRTMKQ